MEKKLKIINVPWHIAHQYELYKLPNTEWYHVINSVRKWHERGKSFRPVPDNLHQVPFFEEGKYDLALLHIDQQCIDESFGKSRLYKEFNEAIKGIPKIVLNHATPYYPEKYSESFVKMKMKMLIGDNHMICNSHRAQEMWGDMGATTRTIIHGLDPTEWWDLPKEPRSITMLSPAGLDRYYNRRLLIAVKERLKQRGLSHYQITVDWVARDFDDYRDYVGRSLIYFNPTLESPMPRSRTEAMLSGCCVLTLPNHGAEKFIEQGVNGFIVPDNPNHIADLIEELINNNYNKCI